MNQNVHLRIIVIDVARSRLMQIIIDQRRHSLNMAHRWVVCAKYYTTRIVGIGVTLKCEANENEKEREKGKRKSVPQTN